MGIISGIQGPTAQAAELTDEVVARVLAGETGLCDIVMGRYNQRHYRAAWLTRLAVDEALAPRKRHRYEALDALAESQGETKIFASGAPNPERRRLP
jgi:hypothetical protein